MTRRWLSAWGLGSVAFGGASLLVPLYLVQLGGSAIHLGMLAATAAGIGAPGAIVAGRLADHPGRRRPTVLLVLACVALTLGVIPTLTSIGAIIVVNAILWLAIAAASPILTMLVVADAPPSDWAERIGDLNTFQGYGWAGGLVSGAIWPLVAPLVGMSTSARPLFWILAGCAVASTGWAAVTLPRSRTGAPSASRRASQRIGRLVITTASGIRGGTFLFTPNRLYWSTRGLDPRRVRERLTPALLLYFLAVSLFFAGFAAFWAPLPLVLSDAGFRGGEIFGLYLVSSLASAVLYGRAGTLAGRYDLRVLQSAALALRGLLFPVVALAVGFSMVVFEVAAVGLALALIGGTWAIVAVVGTTIVTRLAPPAIHGEALGIHTALAAVTGAIGGVLGGWAATVGYRVAFAGAGGTVLVAAGIVAILDQMPAPESGGERQPVHDGLRHQSGPESVQE